MPGKISRARFGFWLNNRYEIMSDKSSIFFHGFLGKTKTRITYQKKDFFDYFLMINLCILVAAYIYGSTSALSIVIYTLCLYMLVSFVIRHGVEMKIPIILKRPQDVVYMLWHKVRNMHAMYFLALGIFFFEQLLIYLTPNLPHMVDLTRQVAFFFSIYILDLSLYIGH